MMGWFDLLATITGLSLLMIGSEILHNPWFIFISIGSAMTIMAVGDKFEDKKRTIPKSESMQVRG